jgi:predicted amidohydrolase YtcJ
LKLLLLATLITFTFTSYAQKFQINNVQGYTFNEQEVIQEFSSILIEDGKVLAIGEEVFPDARIIDGNNKVMLPGLIDAHGHLLGLGATLLQVDVRDVPSAKKTAQKVQEYAQQNKNLTWITGRGWNQVLWPDKRFPTADVLDEYIKNRPVWLERVDGHAGWANTKALELAGITRDSIAPPGGKIERDASGNPSGVLIDNAMNMVIEKLPKEDTEFYQNSLDAAAQHLLSLGITSMHDAGISAGMYSFFIDLAEQKKLPLRIYAMLAATDPALAELLKKGHISDEQDFLSIRSVKAYGDGALGSRGAAMLSPYSDAPHNKGLLLTREQDLKPLFDTVLGSSFQLNFHAIGDRANRLALDQFKASFEQVGGEELRNRVEHAQVIAVEDIPRFKTLGIIPAMQPTHATSDMNMAEDRVGADRLKGAYAWQTFLQQGSRVAFGSDFPVELANPFFGLHAAVTRQNRKDQPKQGWIPNESVSIEQAFKGFTYDAAYAAHQEDKLGSLTPGKWADFILLDQDIFTIPKQQLWRTEVLETWIAGEQVYQKKP